MQITPSFLLPCHALLILCLPLWVGAQRLELPNVSMHAFQSMGRLGDQGYYVHSLESPANQGKKAKKQHKIYGISNDLKVTHEFILPLPSGEVLDRVFSQGANLLVVSSNAPARTRTYQVLNETGQIVRTNTIEHLRRDLVSLPGFAIALAEGDYVMVYPTSERHVGYVVERYSGQLQRKFEARRMVANQNMTPMQVVCQGKRLFVLEDASTRPDQGFDHRVAVFDLDAGSMVAEHRLSINQPPSYGYATILRSHPEGAVVAGMTFPGSTRTDGNSEGFFVARLGGDPAFSMHYMPWIKPALKLKRPKAQQTMLGPRSKAQIVIQDIVVHDKGGFTIIGERYQKNVFVPQTSDEDSQEAPTNTSKFARLKHIKQPQQDSKYAITTSDYHVFRFDNKGQEISRRKVDKPVSITVVEDSSGQIPVHLARADLSVVKILSSTGFLPYRHTLQVGGKAVAVSSFSYPKEYREFLHLLSLEPPYISTTTDVTGYDLQMAAKAQKNMVKQMGFLGRLAQKLEETDPSASEVEAENEFDLRIALQGPRFGDDEPMLRVLESNKADNILMIDFQPATGSPAQTVRSYMSGRTGHLHLFYVSLAID